jgi:hypothetical protein
MEGKFLTMSIATIDYYRFNPGNIFATGFAPFSEAR